MTPARSACSRISAASASVKRALSVTCRCRFSLPLCVMAFHPRSAAGTPPARPPAPTCRSMGFQREREFSLGRGPGYDNPGAGPGGTRTAQGSKGGGTSFVMFPKSSKAQWSWCSDETLPSSDRLDADSDDRRGDATGGGFSAPLPRWRGDPAHILYPALTT